MDREIFNKILKSLSVTIEKKGSYVQFNDKRYTPIKIDEKNFHRIKEVSSAKKIAFIDGGNAEILKSSNFSLQLIRVYSTIYKHNKKVSSKRYEFYTLIKSTSGGERITYKAEVFPVNYDFVTLSFDSFDKTLRTGNNRVDVSTIGNAIRKCAEIKITEELINELDKGDIIVRDGDLRCSVTYESDYFAALYNKALEKNVIITALSKSSHLFTDSGNSLIAVLDHVAPFNRWYYHPLVNIENENHEADMYIVKLHETSNYIFKLEIFKKINYDTDALLTLLSLNSRDPVFLGYPYGLIEADKFARVPNKEKEYLKMQVATRGGKSWKTISNYLNTVNAHDILDNIS
jgi:hypothetical protein